MILKVETNNSKMWAMRGLSKREKGVLEVVRERLRGWWWPASVHAPNPTTTPAPLPHPRQRLHPTVQHPHPPSQHGGGWVRVLLGALGQIRFRFPPCPFPRRALGPTQPPTHKMFTTLHPYFQAQHPVSSLKTWADSRRRKTQNEPEQPPSTPTPPTSTPTWTTWRWLRDWWAETRWRAYKFYQSPIFFSSMVTISVVLLAIFLMFLPFY